MRALARVSTMERPLCTLQCTRKERPLCTLQCTRKERPRCTVVRQQTVHAAVVSTPSWYLRDSARTTNLHHEVQRDGERSNSLVLVRRGCAAVSNSAPGYSSIPSAVTASAKKGERAVLAVLWQIARNHEANNSSPFRERERERERERCTGAL